MSWFETIQGIITLAISGVTLISAVVGLGIKLYGALKELIKNKNWLKVMVIADAAMKEAEASGKEGKDKKNQVIDAVAAACKELGIECDLGALSNYIDECIAFVNDITTLTNAPKE